MPPTLAKRGTLAAIASFLALSTGASPAPDVTDARRLKATVRATASPKETQGPSPRAAALVAHLNASGHDEFVDSPFGYDGVTHELHVALLELLDQAGLDVPAIQHLEGDLIGDGGVISACPGSVVRRQRQGTCAIHAVVVVLGEWMRKLYDVVINQNVLAEALLVCDAVESSPLYGVKEHGTTAGKVVEQLNTWAKQGKAMFLSTDPHCPGAFVVHVDMEGLEKEKFDLAAMVFRAQDTPDMVAPTVLSGERRRRDEELRSDKELHSRHAMVGEAWRAKDRKFRCRNSWGGNEPDKDVGEEQLPEAPSENFHFLRMCLLRPTVCERLSLSRALGLPRARRHLFPRSNTIPTAAPDEEERLRRYPTPTEALEAAKREMPGQPEPPTESVLLARERNKVKDGDLVYLKVFSPSASLYLADPCKWTYCAVVAPMAWRVRFRVEKANGGVRFKLDANDPYLCENRYLYNATTSSLKYDEYDAYQTKQIFMSATTGADLTYNVRTTLIEQYTGSEMVATNYSADGYCEEYYGKRDKGAGKCWVEARQGHNCTDSRTYTRDWVLERAS